MLLYRSIALSLFLVVVGSQEYEYGNEEEEHSDYTHPDYSKYFNSEASSPLGPIKSEGASAGFVAPLDFNSFFPTQQFDFGSASNKQSIKTSQNGQEPIKSQTGFVNPSDFDSGFADYKNPFSQDYFEKAQQAQAAKSGESEYESKPGPNYISYRVPPKVSHYKNTEREEIDDDKEDLNEENASIQEEHTPKKKKKYNYEYNIEHKPSENKIQEKPAEPFSPHYYSKFAQNPEPVTPYQKYSFQPIQAIDNYGLKSSYVTNVQSTVPPFNPAYSTVTHPVNYVAQQTENIPQSLKTSANSCKKVNKQLSEKDIQTGRFKRQAMDCFVCEDPKTGANYEQCSYTSEPENESYFVGKAEKFSQPAPPINYRSKREAKKDNGKTKKEEEEYVNPYDYIKSQSHKYYSKPEEFDSEYYKPKAYEEAEEYRFGPEFFTDEETEPEQSYSEKQTEELKKNPENCKKIKKSGMTCMICKNEKTGGNYEQCSYTSAPAEKKYAFTRERKFDKDDNPIEDRITESSDPKEIAEGTETEEKHVPKRRYRPFKSTTTEKPQTKSSRRSRVRYNPPKKEESSYEIPDHFEKSTSEQKQKKAAVRGLDPKLYGSPDSVESSSEKETKKTENYEYPEPDEYHFKLFPQFNDKQETKNKERRVQVPDIYKSYEAEESKKDVEEVLAEFAKKDRSNCKKAHRKGMTCYLCVDKKGLEHEECMYVSESQPKSTHIAYHEVQKVKSPKATEKDGSQSESKIKESEPVPTAPPKRRRLYSSRTSTTTTTTTEAPKIRNDFISLNKPDATTSSPRRRITRRLRRTKNVSSEQEDKNEDGKIVKRTASAAADPTLKTPEEFKVGPEEGAYSKETKPVFSEKFGATLPKYMVEKTAYEIDFDNFASHY